MRLLILLSFLFVGGCGKNDSERLRLPEKTPTQTQPSEPILNSNVSQDKNTGILLKFTDNDFASTNVINIDAVEKRNKAYALVSIAGEELNHSFLIAYSKIKLSKSVMNYRERDIQIVGSCLEESCHQIRMCYYVVYKANPAANTCVIAYDFEMKEDKYQLAQYIYFESYDMAADLKIMKSTCAGDNVKCLKAL